MRNLNLTANNLISEFYRTYKTRYELMAPNVYPDLYFKEMDILAARKSGFVDEIEVKLSRADYLNDFKKTVHVRQVGEAKFGITEEKNKHDCLKAGVNYCNYFSFLMTEDLAHNCGVPDYCGLYVRTSTGFIKQVKRAPRLHNRKMALEMKYDIARKLAYRFWDLKQ